MTPRDEEWLAGVIQRAETVLECQLAVSAFLAARKKNRALAAGNTAPMCLSGKLSLVSNRTDKKSRPD